MPLTITLKNAAAVDQIYTFASRSGNVETYYKSGATLNDMARLQLNLKENAATNRITAKLSIPTTGTIPSTGLAGVLWTEVGSIDLTAVRAATSAAAADFIAQFASLAGSNAVKLLYTTGVSQ